MRKELLKKKAIATVKRWMKRMPAERFAVIKNRCLGWFYIALALLFSGSYSWATAMGVDLSQVAVCGLTLGRNDVVALTGISCSVMAFICALQYKFAQTEYWDYLLRKSDEQTDDLK